MARSPKHEDGQARSLEVDLPVVEVRLGAGQSSNLPHVAALGGGDEAGALPSGEPIPGDSGEGGDRDVAVPGGNGEDRVYLVTLTLKHKRPGGKPSEPEQVIGGGKHRSSAGARRLASPWGSRDASTEPDPERIAIPVALWLRVCNLLVAVGDREDDPRLALVALGLRGELAAELGSGL